MSKDAAPKDTCICDHCNHPFCLRNDKDCDDYYNWWLYGEPEVTVSINCCPICGNKIDSIKGETREIDVEISHINEKGIRAESIRVCSICGMSLREKQIPSIIMMRPVVRGMY